MLLRLPWRAVLPASLSRRTSFKALERNVNLLIDGESLTTLGALVFVVAIPIVTLPIFLLLDYLLGRR
ncbi:Uncharacterised protein [Mycobacteroides abscessus]|nr:Uncharacterised protein [Mycobacteroides abscessus]CPW85334.1 Uncharacterised protein [Mycobacteroides abscessus]